MFKQKKINFHNYCYQKDIVKVENFLNGCTSRQCIIFVNSSIEDDHPLVEAGDDHLVSFSSMHLAAEKGSVDLIKVLMKSGGNIHQTSYMGTPLHVAMIYNNYEVFEYLLQNNADINQIVSPRNENAYHYLLTVALDPMIYFDHNVKKWIKILFQNGCDINSQNWNGDTVLFYSTPFLLQTLFDCGADINLKNNADEISLRQISKSLVGESDILCVEYYISIFNHILQLRILNYHVNEQNQALYREILLNVHSVDHNKYFEPDHLISLGIKFDNEIDFMKKTFITNKITLYNLLFCSDNTLTRYCENKNFQQILEPSNLKSKLPSYGWLLRIKYQKGKTRKDLLNEAKYVLGLLFQQLPENCVENILEYLKNDNLKYLHYYK